MRWHRERERFRALALSIEQESQSGDGRRCARGRAPVQLLVLLARAPQAQPQAGRLSPYVRQALFYINAALPQPISLAEVGRALSVDRFYLEKHLKETGTTVYHYVLLKRLNLARVLLAQAAVWTRPARAQASTITPTLSALSKAHGMTPAAFARASQSGCGGS
ncbi:MAG: hypothetical protein ACLR7U_08935 [Ruthenibacterium lactatiformans]